MKNLIVKMPNISDPKLKIPCLKMSANISSTGLIFNANNLVTEKTSRAGEKIITAGRGGKHFGKVSAMGRMTDNAMRRC
jgi:hypothetical protein